MLENADGKMDRMLLLLIMITSVGSHCDCVNQTTATGDMGAINSLLYNGNICLCQYMEHCRTNYHSTFYMHIPALSYARPDITPDICSYAACGRDLPQVSQLVFTLPYGDYIWNYSPISFPGLRL